MVSISNKVFLVITLFFSLAFIKAECADPAHCACVEKFGRCDCPHGQCACVEKQGRCDCNKCACVEKFGRCDCPHGKCACVDQKGRCDCHKCASVEKLGGNCPRGPCVYSEQPENYDCSQSFVEPADYDASCGCDCIDPCQVLPLPQHQFYIGPEIYHADRSKAGKYRCVKQRGFIYGGRLGYDRIKRCRLYWGFDALYATGDLRSHRKNENKIKLCFTDENIEGRLGYTIQAKCGWLPTLVPYVGYGYYRETNKFKRPSPLLIKQRISFDYFALGFLSQIYPHPSWVVGLNFKARFLFNSKCRVSDDPEYDDIDQNIKHNVQFRVEVPITYRLNCWCDKLAIALVPFYEYRHYGEHANFPFDFKEAKLNFYGFDIRLMYMF